MIKKIPGFRQKIAATLTSVFVLAVVIAPLFLTARWITEAIGTYDPRQVSVVNMTPRSLDKTDAPLEPFHEPLITVSFDDGWESVYRTALPILDENGIPTTQYIITDTLANYSYMSVPQLRAMQKAGHEIGSHTVSHADLTTIDDARIRYELMHSKNVLTQDFGPIREFTSPYGAYNAHTLQLISEYYRSQKNAEGDPVGNGISAMNTQNSFNPLNIISFSVRDTTTLSDIQKLIKTAEDNNAWLVLTYHQVDDSHETFSVTPQAFTQQIHVISKAPVRIATVGRVIDAWQSEQKTRAQP